MGKLNFGITSAGGGGGEANLGANIGTTGVGVYKDKSGVTLRFRKIAPGSSKVTVTADVPNDEVEIDIVPGNIDHSALLNTHNLTSDIDHTNIVNKGTNTHAEIDTHIGTSNIHLTNAQLNHNTLIHAANSIVDHGMTAYKTIYSGGGGVPLLLSLGASGTYLKSNGATSAPSWATPSASVDLTPGLYISTSSVDPISTSLTQLQLASAVIASANVSLASNILTLETDGIYYVEYDACFTEKDTLGSARGTVETHLQDDSGGSYAYSPGSYGRTYTRETSYQGACHGATFIERDGTDVNIKLYAQKIYSSNNNIKATAQGTSVKIMKVA